MSRYALLSLSLVSVLFLACGGENLDSAVGELSVTPDELDFGPVWIGDRIERPVTLANDGRVALQLSVEGATAPFAGPAQVTVPPADQATVQVAFAPTEEGAVERKLVFQSPDTPPVELSIKGQGVLASLEVAEELDFGAVRVGQELELPLDLRNQAPLAMIDFRSQLGGPDAGAFRVAGDVLQIAANGTAQFGLVFAPARAEPQVATLTLSPCATCAETRVILRGRGIDQDLVATPSFVDFGAVPPGETRTIDVEIKNRGEAVAALREARIEGQGFAVDAAALPADLGEGQAIVLPVTFAPSMTGDASGALRLVDDRGEVALTVGLLAHGGGAVLVADPPAVALGRVPVGWTGGADIVVTNQGEALPAEVVGAVIEGGLGWSATVPVFPAAVEDGGLTFHVQLTTAVPGDDAAVLVLATSLTGQPEVRVPLSAQAVDDPGCAIAEVPSELRFGLVRPGGVYLRDIDLVNAGEGNCIVWDVGLDPVGANTFTLLSPPAARDLAPGERLAVPVAFSPMVASPDVQITKLRYRTSSLAAPDGEVDVSGYAPGIAVVAVPEPVDFGKIPLNRAPRIGMDVENRGYTSVRILAADLAAGSDPEFGLVSFPQFPVTLDGVTKAHFVLDYHPTVAGHHQGILEVQVEGALEPLLVRLLGEGSDEPCGSECDPPVPTCPAPGSGLVNQATTFVGMGIDPNGDPITCEWTIVAAPSGSAATPATPDSCTTTFIPDLVGDYTVRLRVRDPLGNVGECTTAYQATAPTTGLWVEMFWSVPNDVDLHLLHPSVDPNLASSWNQSPLDCYYANMRPEWDQVGVVDNPSLDRDDTVNVGPENIRIDAPTMGAPYAVGLFWYAQRSPGSVTATTNIYCGGLQVATNQTTLTYDDELVLVGTVQFNPSGPCVWAARNTHPN